MIYGIWNKKKAALLIDAAKLII